MVDLEKWIPVQGNAEKFIVESPVFEIIEKQFVSSHDSERKINLILCKSPDWCNIIPVTEDGKVIFVKQFRVGADHETVEVPGGVLEPEDKDVQSAALREMEEETGYVPLPGAKCLSLGWTFPNPALMNNRCFAFVVGPVKKTVSQRLDPGEIIEVIEVPIEEIPQRIRAGEITHALMLNAFLMLSMQKEQTAQALMGGLREFVR